MEAFSRETTTVAMEGDGLEIRLDEAGEMIVGSSAYRAGLTCAR